jgi:hypothetical protein
MEALKVFGNQGVTSIDDLKKADPNTYQTLKDVSGMSDELINNYLKSNAPEGTYVWDQAQISGSSMMVPKVVNGKVVMDKLDLGYTPGPSFKTAIKTDAGVLMINDDGTYDIVPGTADAGGSSGFTLGPGQTRYDSSGNAIATAEGKGENFSIPANSRNNLLKTFTPAEVDAIEMDIRTYGLAKALEGMPDYEMDLVNKELNKDWGVYTQN